MIYTVNTSSKKNKILSGKPKEINHLLGLIYYKIQWYYIFFFQKLYWTFSFARIWHPYWIDIRGTTEIFWNIFPVIQTSTTVSNSILIWNPLQEATSNAFQSSPSQLWVTAPNLFFCSKRWSVFWKWLNDHPNSYGFYSHNNCRC